MLFPNCMKYLFVFFLFHFAITSCNQPKLVTQSLTVNKDTGTALNIQPNKYDKQRQQGIDFIAAGTEPFWSLEIDFDKAMYFKTAGGLNITAPAVKGVKAMDTNVTRYAAETEKVSLIVQLIKQECTNNMSGEKSVYRVTIDAKNTLEKEPKRYEGCGQYLYDYRINDIWVLESVNAKKVNASDFMKGLPQIEVNIAQQKVFGSAGCNNFTGSMELQGKKILTGNLAGTKMACPNKEFENQYLNQLSNRAIPYFIKPGKLHLLVKPDTAFIYRKTD